MHIRRVLTLAVAVAALAGTPVLGAPQDNEEESRRDQERRSQQEQRDTQALVQIVDAAAEGTQPAPTDIGIQWEANHFIRGADGSTYIPFTLAVDAGALAAPDTAIYVRAVSKESAEPAAEQNDDSDDDPAVSEYPWDTVNFVELAADGRLARAVALEPGDYELFIAMKEQGPLEPERNDPPARAGLLRRDISVPDFGGDDLTISSVFIGDVEALTTPLMPEEQADNPYTFGTMRVVPSTDSSLNMSDQLSVLFWIYGAQPTDGKPDIQIDYCFYRKTAEGEEYFNKTDPQLLNGDTLPAQFDLAAGHQVPGSVEVPLGSFEGGNITETVEPQSTDFRLELTVTDKVSGRTLIDNTLFNVEGSGRGRRAASAPTSGSCS